MHLFSFQFYFLRNSEIDPCPEGMKKCYRNSADVPAEAQEDWGWQQRRTKAAAAGFREEQGNAEN